MVGRKPAHRYAGYLLPNRLDFKTRLILVVETRTQKRINHESHLKSSLYNQLPALPEYITGKILSSESHTLLRSAGKLQFFPPMRGWVKNREIT